MRTWTRAASVGQVCGACGAAIPDGAARLVIRPTELSHGKVRCAKCAGEDVPADVPKQAPRAKPTPTGGFMPIRQLAGLPLDWSKQGRDPGEEG